MPFGLEYGGEFDSFTFSSGILWSLLLFVYFFCFSYLALRGKQNAGRTAFYVTLLAVAANIVFVYLQISAFSALILSIAAYLLASIFVSHMQLNQVIKVICIVTINYIIAGFVPYYLRGVYDLFVLYIFYLISENRLKKEELTTASLER
jgi:hypothetical protein